MVSGSSARPEEASTSTVARLAFLCLIMVAANGCAWFASRAATRPPPTEPRSDRLREAPARSAPAAVETPTPARAAEPAREAAPAPADSAPPSPGTDEPDPSAVVDWLLKQRR